MPQVTGTARLSPRSSVIGRLTPSRLATRCVSESQTPSSTREPTRARRPTFHVPMASLRSTSAAPMNQSDARIAIVLGALRGMVAPDFEAMSGAWTPASVACVPAPGWARPGVGATEADASDDLLLLLALCTAPASAGVVVTGCLCIHDAAGRTGRFQAGRRKTSAGMAR